MKLSLLIKLIRPHHYIKNMFIFLPLFFAMKITELSLFLDGIVAFIAFSITASAIYILNDYLDIEEDRKHFKKKYRPLAAGTISKKQAIIIMTVMGILGMFIMMTLSLKAGGILFLYILLNVAYSFKLKHIAILDVIIISIGFVLRLFVGSEVTDISLSVWIVTMTFLLALFLALAKRRDDMLIYLDTGKKMRKVIDGYSLQFLDIAMSIMASVVIMSYINYTSSSAVVERIDNEYLYLTSLFVIMGIMRYLQITFVLKESGSPTRIVLVDKFIQLTLIGWIATFSWILY